MSDEHKKQLQAQLWNIANTLRGAAEGHIRRYLIEDCNWLDAVIGLPANIFCGTDIPTCILVLKNPRDNPDNILFIDAPPFSRPSS